MSGIQIAEMAISSLTVALSLAAVIFSFGVVWRTEKELDISYKLFLGAIIAFSAGEILGLFSVEGRPLAAFSAVLLKFLFAVLFLGGIFTARDLLRKMDGEKEGADGSDFDQNNI